MQFISLLEGPSKEAIELFAQTRNLTHFLSESYVHPQEDYLLSSIDPLIFVVSDGVTLNFKKIIENNEKYPDPSPAGQVSKLFCESLVNSVKKHYKDFNESSIGKVFFEANDEVKKFNNRLGKSDISGNPTGYFSATGSFVIIKENLGYFATICDSFVAHFDINMNLKFASSGLCVPYAVINGEDKMAQYLEKGVLNLVDGDKIFIFTDGFEHYIKNLEFLKLFNNWDDTLKERIKSLSQKMNQIDPEKYGHERSLIAVSI